MRLLFTPILCSFLVFILFFWGLGAVGLVGPDEPRYADVARSMLRSGDYVTPHLFGSPWFEKPPLYYWLAAFSFRLGVSEVAARLPSALFAGGFLGVWFWFARRIFGGRAATIGCLLLASSFGWIGFARAAAMDMLLSTTLGAALISLALWFWEKKPLQLYAFYGLLAVATLAKGPVAVALAGLIALAYLVTCGQRGDIRKLLWTPAPALFAAVAVPWYLLCFQQNGYAFVQEFFLRHNWERYTSDALGHPQPFWFYAPILGAGIFPWTALLLLPVFDILRRGLRPILANRRMAFLFYWVAVPFVFFSLSRNKLPGYLLPVLPALTLWIALIVERNWPAATASAEANPAPNVSDIPKIPKDPLLRKLCPWLIGVSSLFLLGIPVFVSLLPGSLATGLRQALAGWEATLLWPQIWKGTVPFLLWLALLGLILLSLYMLWRKQWMEAVFLVLLGVGLGTLAMVEYLSPSVDRAASVRRVARRVQSLGIPGEGLAVYRLHRNQSFGLSFYMDRALPEWSPQDESKAASFVIARQQERLPEARPLILFPGPQLRLWALPAGQGRSRIGEEP